MKPAAALNVLLERYPLCFFGLEGKRNPIKMGIMHDLLATGVLPASDLAKVLRFYCSNEGYLRASIAGAPRLDLEGNVAGEVTPAQAAHARKTLDAIIERRMAKAKAKRAAALKAPVAKLSDLPPAAASDAPIVAPAALVPPARVVVTSPSAPGRRPILTLQSLRKRA